MIRFNWHLLCGWSFSGYSAPIYWLVHGHMTLNDETLYHLMPWAGNIAKRETVEGDIMSIKSCSARSETLLLFLSFIKMVGSIHLFCHIANRLTVVCLGNSQNCLPQIPKNKIYCSPRDQSIISKAITAAVLMPKSNKKKISSFKLLQSTILRNLASFVWYTILCLKVG